MIAMVSDSQLAFDQIGNSLGGPQLCPISVGHGPLGQETNESSFLFQGQSRRAARCWLGFQRILPTGLQGIAPTHHAARMEPAREGASRRKVHGLASAKGPDSLRPRAVPAREPSGRDTAC